MRGEEVWSVEMRGEEVYVVGSASIHPFSISTAIYFYANFSIEYSA